MADLNEEVLVTRLKREGAQTGELTISLLWNDIADLDLHVFPPDGSHIYYAQKKQGGGFLDVDMNCDRPYSTSPVENVFFKSAALGRYKVYVQNFSCHCDAERDPKFKDNTRMVPFKVYVSQGATGKKHEYSGKVSHKQDHFCFDFDYIEDPSLSSSLPTGPLSFSKMAEQHPFLEPFASLEEKSPASSSSSPSTSKYIITKPCLMYESPQKEPLGLLFFGPRPGSNAPANKNPEGCLYMVEEGETRLSSDILAMLNVDGGEYSFWFTNLTSATFRVEFILLRYNSDPVGERLNKVDCVGPRETLLFDSDQRDGRFMTLNTVKDASGKTKTLQQHEKEVGEVRENVRFYVHLSVDSESFQKKLKGSTWSNTRILTLPNEDAKGEGEKKEKKEEEEKKDGKDKKEELEEGVTVEGRFKFYTIKDRLLLPPTKSNLRLNALVDRSRSRRRSFSPVFNQRRFSPPMDLLDSRDSSDCYMDSDEDESSLNYSCDSPTYSPVSSPRRNRNRRQRRLSVCMMSTSIDRQLSCSPPTSPSYNPKDEEETEQQQTGDNNYESIVQNMKVGKMGKGEKAPEIEGENVMLKFYKLDKVWVIDLGVADFLVPDLMGIVNADQGGELKKVKKYESEECVICLENKVDLTLIPCRHQACCSACAIKDGKLSIYSCPLCRASVYFVFLQDTN